MKELLKTTLSGYFNNVFIGETNGEFKPNSAYVFTTNLVGLANSGDVLIEGVLKFEKTTPNMEFFKTRDLGHYGGTKKIVPIYLGCYAGAKLSALYDRENRILYTSNWGGAHEPRLVEKILKLMEVARLFDTNATSPKIESASDKTNAKIERLIENIPELSPVSLEDIERDEIAWVSIVDKCKRLMAQEGLFGELAIHLSTSVPHDVRAIVQGNDKDGYDILLCAMHNTNKLQVMWSIAHELAHVTLQVNGHNTDHERETNRIFNELTKVA